jgi:lysophospholipase L1-like esterase
MTISYTTRYIHFVLLLSIILASCTNATPVQTTFSLAKSALSYGMFDTDATSLLLDVSSTVPKQVSAFVDISIEDPAGVKTYKVRLGESTIVHSMIPGQKRVTVTSGAQSKFNNEIVGVFINRITFNGSAVPVKQEGKRVVVYGDSISVGGNVDNPSAEAWPVLLRKHFPVTVDAYGYRTLYDDAATVAARSELASRISSWMPDQIWLAIGSNDYVFELWSAQVFGETYAATLDAIHASNPQTTVFAQSPILRANESPNTFGDNLEKYRQQIATACLARSAWCVFVDGTAPAFPQPDELDQDGIHLTTESGARYAKAVLNIIGK